MAILLRVALALVLGLAVAACQTGDAPGASPDDEQTAEATTRPDGTEPSTTEPTEEPDGTDLATGEPDGTDGGGPRGEDEGNAFELDPGDCLNVIDAETNTVEQVDCEDSHEYEIYGRLEIPGEDDDEWPGDEELSTFAAECTAETFEEFVGVEYAASRWYSVEVYPTEEEWDRGIRTVICALWDPESETTEGSAEGSEE